MTIFNVLKYKVKTDCMSDEMDALPTPFNNEWIKIRTKLHADYIKVMDDNDRNLIWDKLWNKAIKDLNEYITNYPEDV